MEAKISETKAKVTGLEKNLNDLDSQEKEKRKGATPHQQQSKEEKTSRAAPKSSGSEKSSSSSEKSSSPSPKTAPAVLPELAPVYGGPPNEGLGLRTPWVSTVGQTGAGLEQRGGVRTFRSVR